MDSLEKYMLFIPNRLFLDRNELYVSFNIAGIPADMEIISMTVQVPLPVEHVGGSLELHEVRSAWDELYIRSVLPSITPVRNVMDFNAETKEGNFDVSHLAQLWHLRSHDNHGVYLRLHTVQPVSFSDQLSPYLLITTL